MSQIKKLSLDTALTHGLAGLHLQRAMPGLPVQAPGVTTEQAVLLPGARPPAPRFPFRSNLPSGASPAGMSLCAQHGEPPVELLGMSCVTAASIFQIILLEKQSLKGWETWKSG